MVWSVLSPGILTEILGRLNENKLVIHIGGGYGDKPAATKRFVATVKAGTGDPGTPYSGK